MTEFAGWIVRETSAGRQARLENLDETILADLDTKVRVHYSTINYKDALALLGRAGVIRNYPLIPGIDLTGEVIESSHPSWHRGDWVVLNGAGAGEQLHGGLAELAMVNGDDLVAVPAEFTAPQTAAIGTAGFTAALSLLAAERAGLNPDAGPVLVSGAGGGVGSIAIALLANCGYQVAAATGRPEALRAQLTRLGADQIIDRAELETGGRPLTKQRWAGVIDAVGGQILASALAGLQQGGIATACGLAAGAEFPGNVMPFIIRGVSLLGIDSVRTTRELRQLAWQRLARDLDPVLLDSVTTTIGLAEAEQLAAEVLAGHGTGRTVVTV